ncbi:MAG: aspartate ammonia-lyase [Calditrichaceae bacterium]|nr:aspartate ammonia-lyase [Calditrichaceae bacterium]MBN2710115.1 aspartate ammonia-lyase [Calditrichaceae bacterium]RQV93437.1 MAG: aspartate ammonia-lyase [Calditrichota bacterium]
MQKTEIIRFLKRIELFRGLSEEEVKKISIFPTIQNYDSNFILFKENMPRKALYLIYKGEVELFKKTTYGEEKRLAYFREYDFFSEGALLDDYPHSTNARTVDKSVILKISTEDFLKFLEQYPDIARKILSSVSRVISRRMRQTTTRVVDAAAQYISGRTRSEHDLLGDREVPYEFYYGIQTLRALENFNISGVPIAHYPSLIDALALVKMAAAKANYDVGLLDKKITDAIIEACKDILNGRLHVHFVVDVIQGGAGTSTNMNANEVIANRALEILGHEKGEYKYCHPNNHVNLSQSTNDAYPTALKIALINSNTKLIEVLSELIASFKSKAEEFADLIKMGRTQLQDAVPMTLGQEFNAYAETLGEEIDRLKQNAALFLEVNMGGTAIGTGINAPEGYTRSVIRHLRDLTGLEIVSAANLVEATQDTGAFVMYSSALKRLAIKLSKIANDLRLLSSGPRAGLNEINLPPMQPGSSIMPGKVNPVIPEVVNQIAYRVIGNDLSVTMAAEAGQLELNVMEPVIAQSLFSSIEILKNGMTTFMHRCIDGITANKEIMRNMVEQSIGLVTALNPVLGYETCTDLAREALKEGRGIYELVLEKKLLSRKELDNLLLPENMIKARS